MAKRTLRVHVDVAPILGRRIAQAEQNGGKYLFPWLKFDTRGRLQDTDWNRPQSVQQVCNTAHDRVCRLTGLDFVIYSLRHTFATRFYRQTKDIYALRTILGHSDIKTTLRYVNDATEQANEAMGEFERREPKVSARLVQ